MYLSIYACPSILKTCFQLPALVKNLPSQWLSIFPAVQSDDGEKQENQSVFRLQETERKKMSCLSVWGWRMMWALFIISSCRMQQCQFISHHFSSDIYDPGNLFVFLTEPQHEVCCLYFAIWKSRIKVFLHYICSFLFSLGFFSLCWLIILRKLIKSR